MVRQPTYPCNHVHSVASSIVIPGIVVDIFFQCMSALLNSVNRPRGSIKWGLAAHTVVMFSLVTIGTAIDAHILRNSFIDDRAFPGADAIPPGPLGYQVTLFDKAINVASGCIFILNSWLADGLLASSGVKLTRPAA